MPVKIIKKVAALLQPPAQSIALTDLLEPSKADLLPWEDAPQPEQKLTEALKEFAALPHKSKRRLYLIHRKTGREYQVLHYDELTRRTILRSKEVRDLKPVIGEREDPAYAAVWRS